MRVVRAERFGGPDVLVAVDAPEPVADAGQVVLGVAAAEVQFVDTQIRRGDLRDYFPLTPPYIPGVGVGGTVISVGDGVDPGWVGQRVIAPTDGGGYAEQVAVPVTGLLPVPPDLDLPMAAALLGAGTAAMRLAEIADIQPGDRVLVTAAGGGLGALLVQLARAAGAQVIGAARGERKLGLVRGLGAEGVDYSAPDWVARVREKTGGRGISVVFDGVGGEIGRAAFEVTTRGGRFSAHGAPSGGFATVDAAAADRAGVTLRGIDQVQFVTADTKVLAKRLTERALADAAAGRLRPVVGQTFPLEKAADAHAAIEAREVLGTTLLLP